MSRHFNNTLFSQLNSAGRKTGIYARTNTAWNRMHKHRMEPYA